MLHIGFSKDFDMVILSNLEIVFYLGIADSPFISPVLEETAHFLLWMHSPFLECVCWSHPRPQLAQPVPHHCPHYLHCHGERGGGKSICVCLGNSCMDIFLIFWFCNISEFCFSFTENKTTVIKQWERPRGLWPNLRVATFPGQRIYKAKLIYKSNNFFRSQFFSVFLYETANIMNSRGESQRRKKMMSVGWCLRLPKAAVWRWCHQPSSGDLVLLGRDPYSILRSSCVIILPKTNYFIIYCK